MSVSSFERVTDIVGIALAVLAVGLLGAVDVLPRDGRQRRRVAVWGGVALVGLVLVAAVRFDVMAVR